MIIININQKYFAVTQFKNMIYEKSGQEFEDFFCKIMKLHNKNFQKVKAYGNIGDEKNDGYIPNTGEYYQVFSPKNIQKETTIKDAIKKLNKDFSGLIEHWDNLCQVKKYNFVINDKFKGVPPPLHKEIIKLNGENSNIEIRLFTADDLTEAFRNLSDDYIFEVVRYLPDEDMHLEFGALNEIVKYMQTRNFNFYKYCKQKLIPPNFEEKIRFNNLSNNISTLLKQANYQTGELNNYFKSSNSYLRKEFQNLFIELYKDSKDKIDQCNDNYSDIRFWYIFDKVAPNCNKATGDAVLVLMSYYFECCDIFESPKKDEVV